MKKMNRKSGIDLRVSIVFLFLIMHFTGCGGCAVAQDGTSAPERIILNLTEAPATSQAVTWRTEGEVKNPEAQIALAVGSPAQDEKALTVEAETESVTVGIGKTVYAHSVIFKSLIPNTLYAYRVGGKDGWSEWNHFRTASDKSEPFKFVYFGDPQVEIESMCSRVFRAAYQKAPDAAFWLFTGDIVNSGEDDSLWGELYRAFGWIPRMTPMILVPGNHEYKKNMEIAPRLEANKPIIMEQKETGLSRLWQPQFTLPRNGPKGLEESAYFIDYHGVRFVMLNGTEKLEEQAKWLKKILEKDPQRWTVVAIHQPFYSTGEDRDNPYNRSLFIKTFDKYSVDLVLQGHDHTYGRTYKLRNGVKQDDNAQGTVYVVSVSGPKQYDPNKRYESLMAKMGTQKQLFQVISIEKNRLQYESYTATGELYDSFELVK
jgi:acid phosphatase type 7